MPVPSFTIVPLEGDVTAALAQVPAAAGVAQVLGPEGRSLLIGRPANLRRWAASRLGAGRPRRKGSRPPTDLRPVATAVRHATTTSTFQQRLTFERLMALHVPHARRRDLKPPVYLHLDPAERFPRVTIRPHGGDRAGLFGPFRNRAAAEAAVRSLHKLFPLRPCDYVFEPDPALPLGLGCIYAQVRTCSAPCLVRITEEAYRGLASEAAAFLSLPGSRPLDVEAWLPRWVAAAEGSRGLVVEPGAAGVELYPVCEGSVLEESAVSVEAEDLEAGLARLRWNVPEEGRDDAPWLWTWLHAPRRSGLYVAIEDAVDVSHLAVEVREALSSRPGSEAQSR